MSDEPTVDPRRRAAPAQPAPSTSATPDPTATATATPETAAAPAEDQSLLSAELASQPTLETGTEPSPVVIKREEDDATPSALDAAIASTLAGLDTVPPTTATDSPMPDSSTPAAADSPSISRQSRFDSTPVPAGAGAGSAAPTPPYQAPSVDATLLETGRAAALAFAARTKGTALSRVAQLQQRVEENPLDGEARLALLNEAESKGDLEKTREVYEDFLRVFPDATPQWISYTNLELSHNEFGNVEALFSRCLRLSTNVDLWKFYLDYIRRVNPVDVTNPDAAKEARGVIAKSFEYALSHVGLDRRAGDMWMEYIVFLKEGQNRGTWEDGQRMDALRKAYQRAVCIPVNNVELIWQEYNAFENNLNKMTAKKFVAELSPSYMTARKVLRELRAQFDHLPMPHLPQRPDWTTREDRDALQLWKKYLAYEEGNPLDIEDPQALQMRVGFAYKKAVAHLRFYSEIWYLAAEYNLKLGRSDEARASLQAGMEPNPSSLLLAYTLAEIEESRQDLPTVHSIYDTLIAHFHAELATLEAATEKEIEAAMAAYDKEDEAMGNGDDAEAREKVTVEKEQIRSNIADKRKKEVDVAKSAASNVWITQMRFARRAEGVKMARQVFAKARKSKYMTWQVMEASAKMELHWNNDAKVATNVFELGLKTFSKDPDYVLQYLDFLISTNNPNNARALFERTVALVEPAKAKPIWDRMAQYEYEYGDFLAAQKIFSRYTEAFPDVSPIDRFAQRFGYHGLRDAITQDLGTSTLEDSSDSRRHSRSPSPRRAHPSKRGLSVERGMSVEQSAFGGPSGPSGPDMKRMRPNGPVEGSPAPSSTGGGDAGAGMGGGGGWGAAPQPPREEFTRARPLPHGAPTPHVPRPAPFVLDPRTNHLGVLPEAVVYFLSILPPAAAFDGPKLDAPAIVDVIATTMLPGSAPGGGLPGERLGIPPRPKPNQGGGGGGGYQDGPIRRPLSPPRRGGGGYGNRAARRASVTVSPITINTAQPNSPPLQATSPPFFAPRSIEATSPLDGLSRSRAGSSAFPQQGKALAPFPISDSPQIKILLLENVNAAAIQMLKDEGYQVEALKTALGEEELINKIKTGGVQALGIRSKTKVTARVIAECPSLLSINCFCIGTNQVDLGAAARAGIPVFNSPYANSRSVAELVISEIIALSRQLTDRSNELHQGIWNKVSKGCWEVRGKTLGIVGYGHIGSQLSVLAEAMGMIVRYYDVIPIMPLGTAKQVDMDELLASADFISLHVPELPETKNLFSTEQINKMKDGSYLINNSRGKVVDIPVLIEALNSGHLAGAALDVFPSEPGANGPFFDDSLGSFIGPLRQCPNLILTPHIGGSTEEAQKMIGIEVAAAIIRYLNYGGTIGSVNFPEVSLRPILDEGTIRLCHVHLNQPGVLKLVNSILGEHNVEKQFSDSKGDVAYLLADIGPVEEKEIKEIYEAISRTRANIATRVLY
ncbi:mRNA 3'-end-processing protein RNA14 [Pseudohyphozyma bogoriensis]|nr:mRNA 3'-end-processing protein RNA14 [Pseudohyphozyma bogoriensis]